MATVHPVLCRAGDDTPGSKAEPASRIAIGKSRRRSCRRSASSAANDHSNRNPLMEISKEQSILAVSKIGDRQ